MISLVTGASGFIGSRLALRLSADGKAVRRMVRSATGSGNEEVANLLNPDTLRLACSGVETVFHCAGYAHAFSPFGDDDSLRHWQINYEGTRDLLEAAGLAGVRHFVFLSSVKAMAEPGALCINEDFRGAPQTVYGQSKLAAEQAVLDAGQRYGMHVVNLRLAMVYGSGGRGNLERMGRLVRKGLFPPLPETGNRRSMVHVDDAISAMLAVSEDSRACGRTYIVASPDAPSGRQLFDALRVAQRQQPCGWAIPEAAIRLAGRLGDGVERMTGRRVPLDSEIVSRLLDSACYSPERIEKDLGWRAKVPLAEGLKEMVGE